MRMWFFLFYMSLISCCLRFHKWICSASVEEGNISSRCDFILYRGKFKPSDSLQALNQPFFISFFPPLIPSGWIMKVIQTLLSSSSSTDSWQFFGCDAYQIATHWGSSKTGVQSSCVVMFLRFYTFGLRICWLNMKSLRTVDLRCLRKLRFHYFKKNKLPPHPLLIAQKVITLLLLFMPFAQPFRIICFRKLNDETVWTKSHSRLK